MAFIRNYNKKKVLNDVAGSGYHNQVGKMKTNDTTAFSKTTRRKRIF